MPVVMYKIKKRFPAESIADPFTVVSESLRRSSLPIREEQSIGIAVGSRGIGSIDEITRAVVEHIKFRGAKPFIIPAMGSHGGATPEGQREVLAGYGITEERMGAPVEAVMEVDELDTEGEPFRVFVSRAARKADGVVLVNRIKPHTDYHALFESGLVKMCVIGLGKHAQALEIHRYGTEGLRTFIPGAAEIILGSGIILGGVAVVENALEQPMHIETISADLIMKREPLLLEMARENMARLPVDEIDLLIVDAIGKDFSGTGLDTNVIGRMRIRGEPEPERPVIKTILVRDISERSNGNALGIGLADVITRTLYDKINFNVMYENALTSTFFERIKVPMVATDDRQAIEYAWRNCRNIPAGTERVVRIRNTLNLEESYVSDPVLRDLSGDTSTEVTGGPYPLCEGKMLQEF